VSVPDEYTWRARIAPVATVISPIVVFAPASAVVQLGVAVASGVAAVALVAIAAEVGRDRGKRLEPALWASWGGSPTLRRLRFRDSDDPEEVTRLHEQIEAILGTGLPTQTEENADPDRADRMYDRATRALREATRDKERFRLVFSENLSYGFRRNLLGLRPWGLAVAIGTLVAAGVLLLATSHDQAVAVLVPALWSVLAITFYVFVVRPTWVRVPAEAYAERLLGAVDELARGTA
jgi:hypothetical protein